MLWAEFAGWQDSAGKRRGTVLAPAPRLDKQGPLRKLRDATNARN